MLKNTSNAIINGYAIFAGGNAVDGRSDAIDVYKVNDDGTLTVVTQPGDIKLSAARYGPASAVVGNYVLFAGGYSGTYSTVIDVFEVDPDTGELTAVAQDSGIKLSVGRYGLASAVVGNYILFAGGNAGSSVSDVIDFFEVDPNTGILNRVEYNESLSIARERLVSAVLFNYVLFAGGYAGGTYYGTIDVFEVDPDTGELIRKPGGSLSVGRYGLASAVVGNYLLFAGGYSGTYSNALDVFEVDPETGVLTSTGQDIKLSVGRRNLASGVVGNHAIFAGGAISQQDTDTIEVFEVDQNSGEVIRQTEGHLSVARRALASAVVGNYAIFAGGTTTDAIDVVSIGVPTYELKYAFGDGDNPDIELPEDEVVEWGTTPTLPDPEPVEGFEFQGWTDDKKGFWEHLEDVPQTGSQILYAQYEEIPTGHRKRA